LVTKVPRFIASFLACILLCLPLLASSASLEYNWLLRNYSKEQGLSQNTVTSIIEDRQGVIWVGTQFGVHKFDGYEFDVYNRSAEESEIGLQSDQIRNLEVDGYGRLWVGTDRGLHYYNENLDQFVPFGLEQYNFAIEALLTDDMGQVWIGANNGLYRVDFENTQLLRVAFKERSVAALAYRSGALFVAVDGQTVERFDPTTGSSKTIYVALKNQIVQSIAVLASNNVVLATTSGIFNVVEGQTVRLFREQLNSVSAMFLDAQQNVWVATSGTVYQIRGIEKFAPSLVRVNSNLPLQQVISVYVDSKRLIWLGTLNDGLFLHNLTTDWIASITNSSTSEFAPFGKSVTAVEIENNGVYWQGSNQGVALLDWNQGQVEKYPLGDKHQGVRSPVSVIHKDQSGAVWVGYRNGPLNRLDVAGDQFISFTPNLRVLITDIIDQTSTKLLFTTRDHGVFTFDKSSGQLTQFSVESVQDPGFVTNRYQSSLRHSDTQVWLGSFDSGLFLFDLEQQRVLKRFYQSGEENQLSGNLIVTLLATDNGVAVGSTNGLSFINLENDEVTNYEDVDPLIAKTIYGLEKGPNQLYWLTTNEGVVQFNPHLKTVRQFNMEDGVPNNEFNSNSLVLDGTDLVAGGVRGLAKLDLLSLPMMGQAPITLLTDFYLAGKKLEIGQHPRLLSKTLDKTEAFKLKHFENGFSLGFKAVHYQAPLKVQYRYRLSPLDQDWIESDYKRRIATYTNLDPGDYIFEVSSSIDGENWGNARQVNFVITPAPWASPLAYFIYFLVFFLIVALSSYTLYRRREFERKTFEQIRKKEQELSLALWGSGDEYWNYHVATNTIVRQNPLKDADYGATQHGDEFETFVHPDDIEAVKASLVSCINEGKDAFEIAYRIKHRNGGWFWVMGKGQVSERKHGLPILISGANKNIDSLKKAQEGLKKANDELEDKVEQRTKKLQQTNEELTDTLNTLKSTQNQLVESEKMASLGNMVAGIAHEINTPLGVAITSLSHIEKTTKDVLTAKEEKSLTAQKFDSFCQELSLGMQMAQRNLQRAGELVNSFKQVSVDQSSEHSRDFLLDELIKDTVNTTRPKFKNSNIEIEVNVPPEIHINSYPGALSQVLLNFITNSVTHGFKGLDSGKITISAEPDEEKSVLIIYRDSGLGIDEANWDKVFEPFYTTNRNKGNTGLGMHISYNLITQKLQGEILLNSSSGAGVEFYIRIPKLVVENNEVDGDKA